MTGHQQHFSHLEGFLPEKIDRFINFFRQKVWCDLQSEWFLNIYGKSALAFVPSQDIISYLWQHKCAIPARSFLILSWDRKVSRYFGIVLSLILNLENLGIDIGIVIEFRLLRYWYRYWYWIQKLLVSVLISILK